MANKFWEESPADSEGATDRLQRLTMLGNFAEFAPALFFLNPNLIRF